MIFTDKWTKEDNNLYRTLIKERTSVDNIIKIMGLDKLKNYPNGTYSTRYSLGNFKDFVKNEIVYSDKITDFDLKVSKSNYFDGNDYSFLFKTDSGVEYILEFVYYNENAGNFVNRNLYYLSFTTSAQKYLSDTVSDDIKKTEVYEETTDNNEIHEIIKRLIYIFKHFHKYYGKLEDVIYVIGETDNPKKINFYRDLIKSSFDNFKEYSGESFINLNKTVYYYEIFN